MQIKGIIKFHVIGDDNELPRWNAIVLQNLINLFSNVIIFWRQMLVRSSVILGWRFPFETFYRRGFTIVKPEIIKMKPS